MIEHTDNLPDWFPTAQTYLLPKNKDTQIPKNYRPIARILTSYKVLILDFNTNITKNDMLPEEQRSCVRTSAGCKDQLLIKFNKMIIEDCEKEEKEFEYDMDRLQKSL